MMEVDKCLKLEEKPKFKRGDKAFLCRCKDPKNNNREVVVSHDLARRFVFESLEKIYEGKELVCYGVRTVLTGELFAVEKHQLKKRKGKNGHTENAVRGVSSND